MLRGCHGLGLTRWGGLHRPGDTQHVLPARDDARGADDADELEQPQHAQQPHGAQHPWVGPIEQAGDLEDVEGEDGDNVDEEPALDVLEGDHPHPGPEMPFSLSCEGIIIIKSATFSANSCFVDDLTEYN